jgi:2-methylcitrate dehydratase
VQVFFRTATPRVQVDCPIGHRKRRAEGMPVLEKKFETSVNAQLARNRRRASRGCSPSPDSSMRYR